MADPDYLKERTPEAVANFQIDDRHSIAGLVGHMSELAVCAHRDPMGELTGRELVRVNVDKYQVARVLTDDKSI